mmetsp:Transcript_28855/g.67493  ORF Transcript_28855/g.67493 Transcript_28855/m.67493 type:complete len:252 (+) Transcript_28855:411-1166(+)
MRSTRSSALTWEESLVKPLMSICSTEQSVRSSGAEVCHSSGTTVVRMCHLPGGKSPLIRSLFVSCLSLMRRRMSSTLSDQKTKSSIALRKASMMHSGHRKLLNSSMKVPGVHPSMTTTTAPLSACPGSSLCSTSNAAWAGMTTTTATVRMARKTAATTSGRLCMRKRAAHGASAVQMTSSDDPQVRATSLSICITHGPAMLREMSERTKKLIVVWWCSSRHALMARTAGSSTSTHAMHSAAVMLTLVRLSP